MKLIGIGHKARQGKDTVARELVKNLCGKGFYAKQYAFADALKTHCRMIYGMGNKNSNLLQLVGTDLYRKQIDPYYWTDLLRMQLEDENPDIAIITDVRFFEEYDFIRDGKGYLIKVERYVNDKSFIADDRDPNHQSEIELNDSDWDNIIENNCSLEGLKLLISILARLILKALDNKTP